MLNENIKQELDKTKFQLELPPELQVQEDLKNILKKKKNHPHLHRVTLHLRCC